MKITDTIAAISSAAGNSGIGIIRVSGDEAIQIVNKIFRMPSGKSLLDVDTHTVHFGHIVDEEKTLDQVLVIVMKNPHSYTGEDTVEIDCHGGMLILKKVLDLVIKNGAKTAEPGEFTKRAFLNGKIDLSQAEAVMDLINSKNDFALNSSIEQLKGKVSEEIKNIRSDILYHIAFIESALDDPEHISLDGYTQKLYDKNSDLLNRIKKLINSADNGKMLKEGINTVIVGKPNAGKSSLLNILVGEEKAIVTDVAGTTRDVLEESIRLHGISLNIIDTAGIRDTDDVVEKIGVEKARKYAKDADLVIYVVDSSVPLDENDKDIISIIGNKKCIALLNKTDLNQKVTEEDLKKVFEYNSVSDIQIIKTSTKENIGIDDFEETIKEMFFSGKINIDDEVCITNMRHKEALMDAYNSLLQVKRSLEDEMPEDFYSIDLMSAYSSLGFIIGEEVDDDLVNEIFSKFCMGK